MLALMVMLVRPPLMLLAWAHLLRPISQDAGWIPIFAAGLLGLGGLVSAPWSDNVKAVVAIPYVLTAVVALPFLALLAVCSTGDCV